MSAAARPSPPGTSLIPYVPRHVVEELLRGGGSDRWRPRRSQAVALFADMSGYTAMSEAFSSLGAAGAEELGDLMNRHFGAAVEIVDRFGGSVGKFGGDSMSAIFPLDDREDAAARAVACSLQIQVGMERFRSMRTSVGAFDLRCKIGVAIGEVLSAVVSAPNGRLEWILAGNAIDGCARAEHHARPGEVVCEDSFRDRCRGLVVGMEREGFSVIDRIDVAPDPAPSPPLPPLPAHAVEVLERFVARSVVARISLGHRRFVNEHRRIAVLFAGYGEIDASSTEGTGFLLDRASKALAAAERFEGYLHQIDAGDKGVLAVISFGAAVAHEDDEERALACARELQRSAADASIGIAIGTAFCGERGGSTRLEYAATGDTMNVAARLMQFAQPGTIVCTDTLAPRARAVAVLRSLAPVSLKGHDTPVAIVELRGLHRRPPHAVDAGSDVAMIGRDAEVAELARQIERVDRGGGTVVFISGEAGVGKSRLSAEVAALARRSGFGVHATASTATDAGSPYLAWRPVVRSLISLEDEKTTELGALLGRIDLGLSSRAPLLGPVVGRTVTDTSMTDGLDAETRAELTTALVTDILHAWARVKPQLIWFDDVQWLDAASRDLFIALARRIRGERVLLLGTFRTDASGDPGVGWLFEVEPAVQLRLEPLGTAAMQNLLAESAKRQFGLRGSQLRRIAPSLVDRAQGNPFYLEQLLSLCKERGIDPTDHEEVAAAALPEGLHRLALARLDTLPQEEQMTLRIASVIGRRFAESWLTGSYPQLGAADPIRRQLESLRRRGFIRVAEDRPEREHVFSHAIVQEAAYATLSDASRRELHEGVARYVERAFGDDLGSRLGTLAHHYGATRNIPKQRQYFRLAADAARDVFANETAIGFYERLLPLVEGAEAVEISLRLGDVRQLSGGWVAAERSFRSALELAEACGDERGSVRARSAVGYVLAHTGSMVEARDLLDAAVTEAERLSDAEGTVTALEHLGFATWQQGDYDASVVASRRLVEIARRDGDRRAECRALDALGLAYWRVGGFARARDSFEEALGLADRVNDVKGLVHIANDFAGLLAEAGDVHAAFEQVRRGVGAARAIGYRNAEAVLIGNAGELYRQHGQLEESLACSLRCLAVTVPMRDRADVTTRLGNIALTLADEGKLSQADDFFIETIALAEAIDDPYLLSAYSHDRAALLRRMGRAPEAEDMNKRALRIASEIDAHEVVVRSSVLDIRAAFARGELTPLEADRALSELEGPETVLAERAMIAYERWCVIPDAARHHAAVETAAEIVAAMPGPEHRRRLETLTGLPAQTIPPLAILDMGDLEVLTLDEALASGRSLRAGHPSSAG